MGQSFFIWNGVDCRSMGVRLRSPLPIIRPEERVNHVQIPGASGDLTLVEGDAVYNSYIHTASISVTGWQNVRKVYDWLRGSGYLTTSAEPDRRQPARVIGAVTLDKVSKNLDIWAGEAQFYCQPLKELLIPEKTITNEPVSVINRGNVTERPLFKVTVMTQNDPMVLSVSSTNGSTATYEAITIEGGNSPVYIDSETCEVKDSLGNSILDLASGTFPTLRPGTNYVSGAWWNHVEITRRERFL